MNKAKEVETLKKLLLHDDLELREFANKKLEELSNPKAAFARLLEDPSLLKLAKRKLDAVKRREKDIFRQLEASFSGSVKMADVLNGLSKSEWLLRSSEGVTPLNFAIASKLTNLIPDDLLTEENMLLKSNNGCTPIAYAALTGTLNTLPEAVITERTLTYNAGMALKYAAQNGHLDQVPVKYLTAKLLVGGALHVAVSNGHLDQIPVEVLTQEVWCAKGSGGATVLHAAIESRNIAKVPITILTSENLLIADDYGKTALHRLSRLNQLDSILGVELAESCKTIVGKDWYEKNLLFIECAAVKNVLTQKAEDTNDIALF